MCFGHSIVMGFTQLNKKKIQNIKTGSTHSSLHPLFKLTDSFMTLEVELIAY